MEETKCESGYSSKGIVDVHFFFEYKPKAVPAI